MAKNITKVLNGPLIKKTGQFKGSTLKSGGTIKKAQDGEYLTQEGNKYTSTKKVNTKDGPRYYQGKSMDMSTAMKMAALKGRATSADSIPKAKLSPRAIEVMNQKNGGKVKKAVLGAVMGMSGGKDNSIYKKTTAMRGKLGSATLGIPGMKPIVKNGKSMKKCKYGCK